MTYVYSKLDNVDPDNVFEIGFLFVIMGFLLLLPLHRYLRNDLLGCDDIDALDSLRRPGGHGKGHKGGGGGGRRLTNGTKEEEAEEGKEAWREAQERALALVNYNPKTVSLRRTGEWWSEHYGTTYIRLD